MSKINICPLGGVGEIGSNMTLIETDEQKIIIDLGILFPYEDFFDINYLIPDLSKIENTKNLKLLISHGHEDHIGAIHHLVLKFPEIEIYAPEFASILIKKKCSEHNIVPVISTYKEEDILYFSDLEVHPIHVNHSIPDTFGFYIRNKNKIGFFFCSDFKVDLNSSLEKPFNLNKLSKLMLESKSNLFMIDSTNILSPKKTESENELVINFEKYIQENRRVFVTLFSSNIYRMQNIIRLAEKYGKKVVPIGRSIHFYLEAAQESKKINFNQNTIVDIKSIEAYSENKLIFILSGCQGDFLGSLRKIAFGEYGDFKLKIGDLFLFSSKAIPGNEKKINRIYNKITEAGCEIITAHDSLIHASGHPCQEDLKILLSHCIPNFYIPIHGESFFLKRHESFILKNYPQIKPYLILNNDMIEYSESGIKIKKNNQEVLPVIYHSKNIILERPRISERRKLATQGVVFISINKISKKFSLTINGLPDIAHLNLEKTKKSIQQEIFDLDFSLPHEVLSDKIRIITRNKFDKFLFYKPMTFVHIL
jgi:ribonuclease J